MSHILIIKLRKEVVCRGARESVILELMNHSVSMSLQGQAKEAQSITPNLQTPTQLVYIFKLIQCWKLKIETRVYWFMKGRVLVLKCHLVSADILINVVCQPCSSLWLTGQISNLFNFYIWNTSKITFVYHKMQIFKKIFLNKSIRKTVQISGDRHSVCHPLITNWIPLVVLRYWTHRCAHTYCIYCIYTINDLNHIISSTKRWLWEWSF